jgi:hypothetical protein
MAPNPMDEAAAQRKVEEGKYLRRLEVCDKLHDIAEAANDSALQRRADELQNRAFEIYKRRTAHCPASRAVFESDRKTLEKHLGSGAPVPATPAGSALITVTGKEGRSTAQEDMR